MGLVSKTLPGLFNGVSQQPPTLRLDSQCEIQENAWSLLVDGLLKRPPTEWVAQLSNKANLNTFMHTISRDVNERYIVTITGDSAEPIEIYDLNGQRKTVTYGGTSKDYVLYDDGVNPIKPKEDLRAVTVADHTILVNTTRVAKMLPPSGTAPPPTALVYVKRGVASSDYGVELKVNDSVAASVSFTTGPADTGQDTFKTTNIASQLLSSLSAALPSDWWFARIGSTIVIRRIDGGEFSLRAWDSYGNQGIQGIKEAVQRFTDLPPEAEDGMILTIEGDQESRFDNFYVRFIQNETGTGVWEETVKPGLANEMDPATLPHRLLRNSDGTFTLKQVTWEPRLIGDENSAAFPSFIDSTINDVFFFKNRLGILSRENVVFSRASDFFNFFPATATDVLDSDPIDVAVSTTKVAVLKHAVPFPNSLLLFSDQQQFTLSASGGLMTPLTVAVDTSTAFETSMKCKPIGIGPNVYFVVPNGDHSTVREYFVQPNSQVNDAADVTAHVPRYLPKDINVLEGSSARDVLFALSPSEPNSVYVYKFYWDADQKAQSSWSVWTFDDEVLDIAILENLLYFVLRKDGQVHLAKMNLEKINSPNLPFRIHLDKQAALTGTYDPVEETTTWALPYTDTSMGFTVVEGNKGNQVLNCSKPNDTTIKAPGDYSDRVCYIGKNYQKRYRFTQWYLRDHNGLAYTTGRLQVRTLTLAFTDTGYFTLEGTPLRRSSLRHEFNSGYFYEEAIPIEGGNFGLTYTGTMVGVSTLGQPSIISGEKRFFVMSNAANTTIDLVNDSYLPSKIQSATFEGLWTTRSRPFGKS